ncbi:MAG: hypothetical protein A2283_09620 [Lentisphaerae bacterium RIFOXYA12_FULL_48_11]|nr:MAG: hypothetical protein A2283_09620 [Lentisphaerae bacterium RIFOXYA12_FULL_48_11]
MKRMLHVLVTGILLATGTVMGGDAPDSKSPLIPMGAITGRPDEKVIKETLETYKAAGVDQYLIYPRSGCELEYMGEEWLQVCEWFAKHAKRLNMNLWLYDEFNWPSGSCKGKVPAENPDFEARQYAVYKTPSGAFEWKIIHSPGWVDNYSFKAMERFIELTHKKYEQRLNVYMGNTIKGIFTDEPAHPFPAQIPPKPALVFRYFDNAEDEYKARIGRNLKTDVEAYISDNTKDEVWATYADLIGTRFRKAYFDPIQAWCNRMGIYSTGHMISENSTSASAKFNGNPLHVLKGLNLPGMDEISTRTDPAQIEWLTLAVAQHAAGRKGNGGLVELFALGPSDQTHAIHRQMIWLCAMHKMDRYVLAIAPIDARGNVEKHAYFNPFSRMQPWFPALRLLGDESRIAAQFACKPVICDIGIRYPQAESARLAIKKGDHPALLATLKRFSTDQLTYDLYEENEKCDKPMIFSFAGKTIKEEKSGRAFETPDEAVAFARTTVPPAARVETADGKPVDNLLLRCYQDGSIAVLSLSDKEHGDLKLLRKGQAAVSFNLVARGIFLFEGSMPVKREPVEIRPFPADKVMDITLGKCNTHRLIFSKDGSARVTLDQPLDAIRLAVRNYPERSIITMDGKPVKAKRSCDTLLQGFNELYLQTKPFRLEAGEHVFQITGGGAETNYYLPVAVMAGSFATEGTTLKPLPGTANAGTLWKQGLAEYAGNVSYKINVDVPAHTGKMKLRLNTGGLYTSVSLDGKPIGERAWKPFEWNIPDEAKGTKAELAITICTSIGPMFGDPSLAPALKSWGKTFPAWHADVGLLSPPEWILMP